MAEAFLLGIWKNFDEMETELTMEELEHILEAGRKKDMLNWKFQASLKGINLDDEDGEGESVQDKIDEITARVSGVSKETHDFNMIGISVESE